MRGGSRIPYFGGEHERPEPDGGAGERVGPSLLAVDDADDRRDEKAGLPEDFDGLERGTTRRDDILDEADPLSGLEHTLDPVSRAVILCGVPDDHERKAGLEGGGRGERDGPELGRGEPHRIGIVLDDCSGDGLSERPKEVGPG